MAVVLAHASTLFSFPGANALSRFVVWLCFFGTRGVQFFFVISGFVIAYSLRDATQRRFSLRAFILRRTIRLDPTYWVGTLAMWAVMDVQAVYKHEPLWHPPLGNAVAHLFYLQGILGYGSINMVAWTLCIEFQLYLVFALLLVACNAAFRTTERRDQAMRTVVLTAFFASLVINHAVWPAPWKADWFIPFWYMFLAGVLLCWEMLGRISQRQFLLCVACMALGLIRRPDSAHAAGLLATVCIHVAVRRHTLGAWLSSRLAQWLGRLSYCIYMMHVPVMFILVGLRTRIAATSNTLPWALLVAVCGATLIAAQLVHVCVEKPSLALSARLKSWTPLPLRWGRASAVPATTAAVYLPAAASGDGEPR